MRIPDRSLIRMNGPDVLSVLERTVTNSVADWNAGEWRPGALLTPQGKVISDFLALRTEDGVILDAPEALAPVLAQRLKMYRLRAKADIAEWSDAGVVVNEVSMDPRSDALPGRTVREDASGLSEFTDWPALAMTAGVPEGGRDYGFAEVFPTDVNLDLMGGIDYKKGCFVGQEVASRMKRRGTIRKRTLPLQGSGVEADAAVAAGGPLGTVTSAADGAGLARLRTDRLAKALADGVAITAGGAAAEVSLPDWLSAELASNG